MKQRYSKLAERLIAAKMHKMKDEDRPYKQKVAISLAEARAHGAKVPMAPKKK